MDVDIHDAANPTDIIPLAISVAPSIKDTRLRTSPATDFVSTYELHLKRLHTTRNKNRSHYAVRCPGTERSNTGLSDRAQWLPYDVDHTTHQPADLAQALTDLGILAYVHQTWSHTPAAPRMRAWIVMARPYTAEELPLITARLHKALSEQGFEHEPAKENNTWAQAFYLPSCHPDHTTDFYTCITSGEPYDVPGMRVLDRAPESTRPTPSHPSVIDSPPPDLPTWHTQFNKAVSLPVLLSEAGYTCPDPDSQPDRWLHPSSESGQPGAVILTPEHNQWQVVYEHNATGPLYSEDGVPRDPFEVLRILHCNGDYARAAHEAQAWLAANVTSTPSSTPTPTPPSRPPQFRYKQKGKRLVVDEHNARELFLFDQRFHTTDDRPPIMWDSWGQRPVIHPSLRDRFRDEVNMAAELGVAWSEHEAALSSDGLAPGDPPSFGIRLRAVESVMYEHPVNTLADLLDETLPDWDGTPRVDTVILDALGIDDTPQNRSLLRRFIIAIVARVYEPGCEMNWMPVFIGPQGIGKTAVPRCLAGPEHYVEASAFGGFGHGNIKELMTCTRNAMVVEAAEHIHSHSAALARWKAEITAQTDTARPAYARRAITQPRRFVIYGTSNEARLLHDPTGKRRIVPFFCEGHPSGDVRPFLKAIERDRLQILAEARAYYRNGEDWNLTPLEQNPPADHELARRRDATDAPPNEYMVSLILSAIDSPNLPDWWRDDGVTCIREMAMRVKAVEPDFHLPGSNDRAAKHFADCLRAAGLVPLNRPLRFGAHGLARGWAVPTFDT